MTKKYIPYGHQSVSDEDIEAVVNVLKSDWLTQGPTIEKFERTVAEYCNAKYAVAVNSGTAALHIACLAIGLGKNDILWTSTNSFLASANCGLYCEATVDFVDINPKTFNMDAIELEKKLALASKKNKLPKVVIPVHFAGQTCDMKKIAKLAKKYNFIIIEDACHALGGSYCNVKIGSCTLSDMTVFSFHPIKTITTGEGGMVVTNNKDLYDRMLRFRSHGITRDPNFMKNESHGPWYYEQIDLGYNYRITDIQAGLGISQMKRIDEFVKYRNQIADKYNELLKDLPVVSQTVHPDNYSAYHLYVIRLQSDKIKKTHKQVFEELRNAGIGINLNYIPIHIQPYYQKLGFKYGDFPEAEKYYKEAISLPVYYGLKKEDQDYVVDTLKNILGAVKK
ncbi:UDP-4-amino-4,6-dideoxy-N-acetyl-beta-L-altrosamine transaminase [Candidatus Poribacteria bacterium]|nr:UDP-4-amino-4,6-dideoxy-N-acetyl-beta-L-altrosamine transaminase [Candidatus Poribacteria bacterium]